MSSKIENILYIVVMMPFIILALIIIVSLSMTAKAGALKLPADYNYGECELIAKDFKAKYMGNDASMVFIAFRENGKWATIGGYQGHWINSFVSHGHRWYLDYGEQNFFYTKEEVQTWFQARVPANIEVYDLSYETIPYSIAHNYP